MKKWIFAFFFLSFGVLTSFRPAPFFNRPQSPYWKENVEKSLPKLGKKENREAWLYTIKTYIEAKEWHLLGLMARAALNDKVSLADLEKVAQETNCEPFINALGATKKIRALSSDLGINRAELVRLALFLETELEPAVASTGNYLSRRKTGYGCTIEHDPVTKHTFIHLNPKGKKQLGKGVKKTVSKAILYDSKKPELIASCTTSLPLHTEIHALEKMKEASGIVKLYAKTERTTSEQTKVYTLMCELYRGGSLAQVQSRNVRFSFKQKLDIALQILTGLDELHEKKLVHRDLTTKNVLLDYDKVGKRKSRKIKAVLCDLGRATTLEKALAVKPQANMAYMPPEGIIYEKLEGKDYFATDIYALGCVFQQLLTSKKCPWIDLINLKNPTQPGAVREAKYVYDLTKYRKARFARMKKNSSNNASSRDRFEKIILTMIHPDPNRRSSAKALRQELELIVKGAISQKSTTLPTSSNGVITSQELSTSLPGKQISSAGSSIVASSVPESITEGIAH